jgi:uncharacterized protein YjgD (DUF1641 family)
MASTEDSTGQASLEEILAELRRVHERLDRLEATVERVSGQGADAVATAVDIGDELARQAAERGIDIDARMRDGLGLLERLTAPQTIAALEGALRRIDRLEEGLEAVDALPGMVAMSVDIFDEWAAELMRRGLDIEMMVSNLTRALYRFARLFEGSEIEDLLDAGILEPATLDVVGRAGRALADARTRSGERRVGVFRLFRSMRDSDIQRAVDFGLQFGRRFGQLLHPQLEYRE